MNYFKVICFCISKYLNLVLYIINIKYYVKINIISQYFIIFFSFIHVTHYVLILSITRQELSESYLLLSHFNFWLNQ